MAFRLPRPYQWRRGIGLVDCARYRVYLWGSGKDLVYKDAMIDIGLVLEPIEGQERVFRRIGYFEQHYWERDAYPVFAGNRVHDTMSVTIV